MRNALAQTLYELAREDPRIVVIVADISPAGAMEKFRAEFPDRFINVGVAEQSMIGLAAGLAMRGLKPFCYTIATFALFRAYEFLRCDLAYQNLPVTVVGMGAGLSYPSLGGTHQAIEDVSIAMACPNLTVLAPCDPEETSACARWCAERDAGWPVYMRIGKAGELSLGLEPPDADWRPGVRLLNSYKGANTCILTYGPIAAHALMVAQNINADTIAISRLRPLPRLELRLYRRLITIEEASGEPLACALREAGYEVDRAFSLPRTFPHMYGTRDEMLARYGLTANKILYALNAGTDNERNFPVRII